MQSALGVTNDLALSKKMGSKSRGLVSNWRKNDKVPAEAIETVSQISGKSFEEIRHGKRHAHDRATSGAEQSDEHMRLVALWDSADEDARDNAIYILEKAAAKSRRSGRQELSCKKQKSA
jgi:hypothetical protein